MSSLARIAVLLAFTIVLASPNLAAEDGEHTHSATCGFDPAKHWVKKRSATRRTKENASSTPTGAAGRGVFDVDSGGTTNDELPPKWVFPVPTSGTSRPYGITKKTVIKYAINTSGSNATHAGETMTSIPSGFSSSLNSSQVVDAIKRGAESWNDACGVVMTFVSDGSHQIMIGGSTFPNGQVGLGGASFSSFDGISWFCTAGFVQLDTSEAGTFWTENMIRAVTAHEVGHALCLEHTNLSGNLMFGTASSSIRAPQPDDMFYAQFLYGNAPAKLSGNSSQSTSVSLQVGRASQQQTNTNSNSTFEGGMPGSPDQGPNPTGSLAQNNVTGYKVERKPSGGSYTTVAANQQAPTSNNADPDATHSANEFTFNDSPASGTWVYKVTAIFQNSGNDTVSSDEVTVSLTTGPIANADSYNVNEETTLTVTAANDVLENDSDPVGGGLTAIKVTDPSHAQSFTFNSDGTFTYTPVANYFGADTFTYKVEDTNTDQSAAATVTINISNVNDNPTLTTNSGLTVNEGEQGTIGSSKLLVSDIDNTTSQITFTLTTAPTNGSLRNNTTTINASGTFTQANVSGDVINYLHNGGEPTTDSFQVTVSDGSGGGGNLGTITFNITITPQNDAPTLAANTGLTVNEGAQGTINNTKLQATDPDSGTLTFTLQTAPANGALRNNTTTISQGQTFTQANINANVINYLHNGGETTSDSFVFSVSDGSGGNIGNTTFNISVTAVNDNPTLTTNAGLTVNEGAQGTVDNTKLLVSDVDSGTITFTLTSAPANGTLRNNTTTINASGTFTQANIGAGVINYLHNGGETTTDSFQVTVSDGNGGGGNLGTITFNITITPVNDPPVASITTPNASEVDVTEADTVDFVAFATDPENDSLTYTWDFGDGTGDTGTNVSHQFAPGSYVVTVTVSDGNGGVDVASVTVNVAGGASDGALLVLKGSFTVAWSSHAKSQLKDKFTLAGTLNPSGLPAVIPGGAEVEVWANAAGEAPVLLTGAAMPLDAKGSSSGAALDGTDKFKVKVSPKNGKYSVSVSNTDLRSVLGLTENAATNQTLPVEANLVFKNVPTMAFPSLLGNCEFLYTTKQSSSSKGKFALKSNDLLSGAFVALKTSAAQDKASSDYKVTLTASMVSGGGGPVEPTGPVTVTIGGADPIVIPNGQLVLKGSGPSSTYTLAKGGAPGLLKFSISNSKKSLSLATDLLPSTGIPVVNDPGLEHELTITIDVEVNGGDTHTFDTTVELMRSSITTGKWKR